jgi:hypothetical protein
MIGSMVIQIIYLKMIKNFYHSEIKAVVIKKFESQRYKRICDTVQEGILIL